MENQVATASSALSDVDPKLRATLVRIIQLKAILDANKPLYEELDRLTLELQGMFGVTSLPIKLTEKEAMYIHGDNVHFLAPDQIVTIVDNFANKNVVFRPVGVKRFESMSETADEFSARMIKEEKKKNATK